MLNPIKRLALSGYLVLDKIDFGLFFQKSVSTHFWSHKNKIYRYFYLRKLVLENSYKSPL